MTRARVQKPQTARGDGGASRSAHSSREGGPERQPPSSLARLAGNHATANAGFLSAAREIATTGTFSELARNIPVPEMNKLFGPARRHDQS